MVYQNWANQFVEIKYDSLNNAINAMSSPSKDGRRLMLQVANNTAEPFNADISVAGFESDDEERRVVQIQVQLRDINMAVEPSRIVPTQCA